MSPTQPVDTILGICHGECGRRQYINPATGLCLDCSPSQPVEHHTYKRNPGDKDNHDGTCADCGEIFWHENHHAQPVEQEELKQIFDQVWQAYVECDESELHPSGLRLKNELLEFARKVHDGSIPAPPEQQEQEGEVQGRLIAEFRADDSFKGNFNDYLLTRYCTLEARCDRYAGALREIRKINNAELGPSHKRITINGIIDISLPALTDQPDSKEEG